MVDDPEALARQFVADTLEGRVPPDDLDLEKDTLLESQGPGDDDDDDDDDDEDLSESGYSSPGLPDAPWSPIPTWLARQFQEEEPETKIEVLFPTVYEENRSEKIKDLAAAQAESWISHRRAAESGAKEFGFEDFEYDKEQATIKMERKAGIGVPQMGLGAGDALAKSLGLTPSTIAPGPGGNGQPPTQPGFPPERSHDEPGPKRQDVSHPAQAEFRQEMRHSEADAAELRAVTNELRQVREALTSAQADERDRLVESVAGLTDRLGELAERLGKPPRVHVEVAAPQVHVPPAKAPVVKPVINVEVQAPKPGPVRFERDKQGAIIRSVPEEPHGQ